MDVIWREKNEKFLFYVKYIENMCGSWLVLQFVNMVNIV